MVLVVNHRKEHRRWPLMELYIWPLKCVGVEDLMGSGVPTIRGISEKAQRSQTAVQIAATPPAPSNGGGGRYTTPLRAKHIHISHTPPTPPNSTQLTQLITENHLPSNHIYTKSTPNHIHHHYAMPLYNTHTSSLQLHPHTHHIVTLGFVDKPHRSDYTAGKMDGEAGWWTTIGYLGFPH